ncbi:MAG: sulfatase-like hydrolase/transferase [Bacteroidetes bacterium]|nr:sulfatase-like hydrolase/transferase [Bacteroidota bacterium]
MKKALVVFSIFVLMACKPTPSSDKPKLVVVISIDQMKSEYLTRFNPQLEAGFKYLLDSGVIFTNAHHNHATTTTAAGHATLATGYYPSHNGIVDNTVYNRTLGFKHYSIEDTTVSFVGIDQCELNKVSAQPLLKPTLGDRVKAADAESKVYSVALKDRASILMGGKNANRAFWFDAASTQMVSTDYYTEAYPTWAKSFTANTTMTKEIENGWVLDESFVKLPSLTTDSFEVESGSFKPWFPHTIASFDTFRVRDNQAGSFIWNSPYGDAFVLKFAKKIIDEQKLGHDNHTDVLTVGLSAADVIGHHFGPNSYEVLDYYNKLDFYLADFIEYLNTAMGQENYMVVITADHGVASMPEYLAMNGVDARRIQRAEFTADMAAINANTMKRYGLTQNLIIKADYGGVEPNLNLIKANKLDLTEVITQLTSSIAELSYIEDAYSHLDIADSTCTKKFIEKIRNSHRDGYGYFIKLVPRKNYLVDMRAHGTTHGTPYDYDTHVPMIFKIPGKSAVQLIDTVQTVDIVPTILSLLGIDTEENFDGSNLTNLLD